MENGCLRRIDCGMVQTVYSMILAISPSLFMPARKQDRFGPATFVLRKESRYRFCRLGVKPYGSSRTTVPWSTLWDNSTSHICRPNKISDGGGKAPPRPGCEQLGNDLVRFPSHSFPIHLSVSGSVLEHPTCRLLGWGPRSIVPPFCRLVSMAGEHKCESVSAPAFRDPYLAKERRMFFAAAAAP